MHDFLQRLVYQCKGLETDQRSVKIRVRLGIKGNLELLLFELNDHSVDSRDSFENK